ncbi:glycosyltransferase [Paenibacillus humicus]|uniref:glycosyltransferase n=1 Tax=Paenibacillus humicus TaxID=412861 RepID=UPI003F13B6EC
MIKTNGKVSIIMPGYNEGSAIYTNLLTADKVFQELFKDYEIIFVNDGSSDDTLLRASNAADVCPNIRVLSYPINSGKGNALREGTTIATGKYIVFMDSDLDLPPRQLTSFFQILFNSDADVVIGSKMHPESIVKYPFARKVMSYGYYLFLLMLFRLNTHDTQTGMKLFKSEVIKPVMDTVLVKKFAFDIEVLSIIRKRGFKISESPIVIDFNRGTKWGRIKTKDILHMLTDTLAIFYRLNILKYYDLPKVDTVRENGMYLGK